VRGLDEQNTFTTNSADHAGNGTRNQHVYRILEDLGFWFNSPPPLMLRVNLLRTSRESVLEAFARENIPAEAGELAESIVLTASRNVAELPGFTEGDFSVQDLTAMKAVELLNPKPGETIWDVCAAPGTKTTAIAERMQNQGRVLATDIHPARLALIEDNRSRLGLDIIKAQRISAAGDDLPGGPFDAVLVDVPCSNTGVLGKRVEARWRLTPADFEELPGIQSRLLEAACERVKPGGRVVYSTCSIEPEENEAIVAALLSRRPDWKLVEQQTHWPGRPADGGFAAWLQKFP
jgi:16S rRNA (cytosine967-C5)-methyltransferase